MIVFQEVSGKGTQKYIKIMLIVKIWDSMIEKKESIQGFVFKA